MTIPNIDRGLRALVPTHPELADGAWRFFVSAEGDERFRAMELLDLLLFIQLQQDFTETIRLPPPKRATTTGAYALGTILYPDTIPYAPFALRESDWLRHMLITGMTGAGKSNLVLHILRLLQRAKKPFLVFDWKRSYRDALQLPEFKDLLVYTVADTVAPFRFNPLIPPPGMPYGHWLMKLVDVIKHAYFVGDGVEYLLRRALDRVYKNCGYETAKPHHTPLFEEARLHVLREHAQGRIALWKASTTRVLESLCFPHGLGPVVNTPNTLQPDPFLRSPIVLELDTLADADKIFLTEALILWIYEYRKRQPHREHFHHALIIEEAHHILSEHKERHEGAETIIETCLRQIRELGEAVIAIDQEPSKISHSIRANTATKITFRLGTGDDTRTMAQDHGLDHEETRWLDLLQIGHAIAHIAHRIPRSIHVSFPHVPIKKGLVTNQHVSARYLSHFLKR